MKPEDTERVCVDKGKTSRSQEIDDKRLHKELVSSDRSGKPEKLSENIHVKHAHDGTLEPVKSSASTHTVEEQFVPAENRDIASSNTDNEFNRATDEENIDFNIRRKKHYENIHDRFIRDTTFRKTMIELGRSENVILEMDRLASEDHSHITTEEEIAVYIGNWWIRSNLVNSDTMPTRHRPDFKKALSTLYRLKKAEDKKHYEKWSQSSSSWWQWRTNWWEPDYETSPQRWSEH